MAQWRKVIVSGSSAVLNQISASGNIVPISDAGSDLGSSTREWNNLYIDGTANIDSLVADTADINAGTVDAITSLTAAGNLDIGAHGFRANTLTADAQTSGRVAIYSTAGLLSEDSDLTFSGDTLTATKVLAGAAGNFTVDGLVLTADTITNDAALTVVSTGLTFNASLDIALSADGGNVTMDDGTTTIFDFNVDDTSLTIHDDQDTGDTAVITMAQHGALSIVTTDDDAAAANIQITADGTAELAGTTVTLDSGTNVVLSPAAGSHVKIDDVIQVDSGVITGATSITSTNFVGIIDGALGSVTPAAVIGTTIDASTDFTIDGLVLTADTITNDATLTMDISDDMVIDVDGGNLDVKDNGAMLLNISATQVSGSSTSTGSFGRVEATTLTGDGSGLTGVAQDIDLLTAYGASTLHQTEDLFHLSDNGTEKSINFSNLEDSIFANVSGDAGIAGGGDLSLTVAAITNQTNMTGDVADADELIINDGGSLKRVDFSVFRDAVFNDVSGDATMADGGAISLADNTVDSAELVNGSVDDGHLSDGVATGLAGTGMTATSGVMNVIGTAGAVSVGADAVTLVAANTTLTSILNTSLGKIGTATAEEYVTFGTSNEVNTFVGNTERHSVTATGVDVTGNLTISGDLTVSGDQTIISTTNLSVEDKFAVFASGSTSATDGGIIVSKQADGAGFALGYDTAAARWGLDDDLAISATDLVPNAYVGTVEVGTTAGDSQGAPHYGGSDSTTYGVGSIYIKTDDNEIWIYA
jgi:hypothetical protein